MAIFFVHVFTPRIDFAACSASCSADFSRVGVRLVTVIPSMVPRRQSLLVMPRSFFFFCVARSPSIAVEISLVVATLGQIRLSFSRPYAPAEILLSNLSGY